MSGSRSSDGWLSAIPLVFVLIWSTGFIVARYGMPHAPPLSFLALRYALSISCFLAWIAWAKVAWPQSRAQWLHLSLTGILMHAGYLGGVWVAVKAGMGSGLSSLIVGFQPVLTAIWLAYSLRGSDEPGVSRRQWLGLLLGFVGLLMVVWRKLTLGTPLDHVTPVNMAFALAALLSITVGTLYQKRFVQACDVRSANTVQLLAALVVTLPFALMETEAMRWNGELAGAMVWSVLGLTIGGSSLLYMLIQRGAAASVTSLMYLVPPTTALMAWLLFGEAITWVTLLGTALTAVGVSWVVRPSRR
ncbi:DMT family transporter [Limnohabitans sp. Rim8]|jgi:drug/metabolite transporter (DMT)-like permease|uniref:DMT family transporter n=1 Tax=Limnohabitans sp. Rim8 TaxID=1100718 RepID=UPI0025F90319|nr:DMT family transporter [Limnohabitans sp. Rim8]